MGDARDRWRGHVGKRGFVVGRRGNGPVAKSHDACRRSESNIEGVNTGVRGSRACARVDVGLRGWLGGGGEKRRECDAPLREVVARGRTIVEST
eukprot:6217533-Prymnesium_polylepis.1